MTITRHIFEQPRFDWFHQHWTLGGEKRYSLRCPLELARRPVLGAYPYEHRHHLLVIRLPLLRCGLQAAGANGLDRSDVWLESVVCIWMEEQVDGIDVERFTFKFRSSRVSTFWFVVFF